MSGVDLMDVSIEDKKNDDTLHSLYEALVAILDEEHKLYADLHDFFKQEREFIIHSAIDELLENNSKKETCILKARMLSEMRTKTVSRIAFILDTDVKQLNLSSLAYHGSPDQNERLQEFQTVLHFRLAKIQELIRENKSLIDSSLLYVRKSVDFIRELISPTATYQITGKINSSAISGTIVSSEG